MQRTSRPSPLSAGPPVVVIISKAFSRSWHSIALTTWKNCSPLMKPIGPMANRWGEKLEYTVSAVPS